MKYMFSKIHTNYVFICLISILLSSCEQKKKSVNNFIGREIIFPMELSNHIHQDNFLLILYLPHNDCNICTLKEYDIYKLYKKDFKARGIDILFIGQETNKKETEKNFKDLSIPFPIIWDKDSSFLKINQLPSNPIYHNFIIDKSNEVVWIGAPLYDSHMWEMFKKEFKEP